jgi:hypothetical protein
LDLAFALTMFNGFLMNQPGWTWTPAILLFVGTAWLVRELIVSLRHLPPGEKWPFGRSAIDELDQHIQLKADALAHWVLILLCFALEGASRLWPSRPELRVFRGLWSLLLAVRWLTSAAVRWRYR